MTIVGILSRVKYGGTVSTKKNRPPRAPAISQVRRTRAQVITDVMYARKAISLRGGSSHSIAVIAIGDVKSVLGN